MGFHFKIENRVAKSVDPDETTHYDPLHLDLPLRKHAYSNILKILPPKK